MSRHCNVDGTAYEDELCDSLQGLACDGASGNCHGDCSAESLGRSYIGCDYFPTITGNLVSASFDFAVAISNLGDAPTTVTIDGGALASPRTLIVPAAGVAVEKLPWVADLKEDRSFQLQSARVTRGAYHLRSNHPITVYQFNALEYLVSTGPTTHEYSYTNDASMLIPGNALSGSFVVASWPTFDHDGQVLPGELAVTATRDDTQVTITPRCDTRAGDSVAAFVAETPRTVLLGQGDVLQLLTDGSGDLTGSMVTATKPVQVIAGHYCTNVPLDTPACDHLEESMFPVETLGATYLVASPAVPSIPGGNEQIVRIIAATAGTHLTYNPPIPDAPAMLAEEGGFVELGPNNTSFEVTADHKILVAQYMVGENRGGGTGDPSMVLAVPRDQYRTSYLFHAPLTYDSNYVNVTAPLNAAITLDGHLIADFTPMGTTGFGVHRERLAPGGDGNHRMMGDQPFGISVYGYAPYTSYWYPGGLDFRPIITRTSPASR